MDFDFDRNMEVGVKIVIWPLAAIAGGLILFGIGHTLYQCVVHFNWSAVFGFVKIIGILAAIVVGCFGVFGLIYCLGLLIQVVLPRVWRRWTTRWAPRESNPVQTVAWQREGF
jgi:hypothetical protein